MLFNLLQYQSATCLSSARLGTINFSISTGKNNVKFVLSRYQMRITSGEDK